MDRDVYRRLSEIEETHWWFAGRRNILSDVLSRLANHRRNLRILEAGCGTGGNLRMLARFGRVTAFEPDAEARRIAEAKTGTPVSNGTLPEGVPFSSDVFDIVVALDVIEHVKEDRASLIALRDRLVPGGRLVITVPALSWLWSGHDVVHHHFRRYSRAELQATLEAAGLKPVMVTYYNSFLFPMVAAVRLFFKALGRERVDDRLPSPFVNRVLLSVFSSERRLIGRVRFPLGVSLLAVAERPLNS